MNFQGACPYPDTAKVNIRLKPARVMLPNRCSIKQGGRQCPNPPEFIISITSDDGGEYMLGVTCSRHKRDVRGEIQRLQDGGKVARGTIGFASVKSVGTDCIRADPDELVQIGGQGTAGGRQTCSDDAHGD